MQKTVAISQSNYIPWRGYFRLIHHADAFVLYDDMQYTKRDWRNRNKISTPNGLKWLTVPVSVKGKYHQSIYETQVSSHNWAKKHFQTIHHSYKNSPWYKQYAPQVNSLYQEAEALNNLSDINQLFLQELCKLLNINTHFYRSSEFELNPGKTEKLLGICKQLDANVYLSGPAAKSYLDVTQFSNNNISTRWLSYDNLQPYKQKSKPFEPFVSILDLLFNTGPEAMSYIA